jgi:hypothetical protein
MGEDQMDRRVIIGIVVGVIVLCICGAIGFFAVLAFAGAGVGGTAGIDAAQISVSVPPSANQGDTVSIQITVQNPTGQNMDLDSIDIDNTYLNGIAITGSSPSFTEQYSLEPFLPQESFTFHQNVPAGGSLTVLFTGTAVGSGTVSGALDVCIDDGADCKGTTIQTVINP